MKPVIGQNIHRVDGEEKVTGKAIYTGDLKFPGLVHGKMLRSPLAHARIQRIDSRQAESIPGVLAVLTRDNCHLTNPYLGAMIKDQPIVALEKVRYAGDIVAAVVTTEEEIAEEALKKIEVDYEELPTVLTIEEALREDAPLIHEKLQRTKIPQYGRGATYHLHENSNICHHFRYQRGDGEKGFDAADCVFEDTFVFPSAQHYTMEPNISVASLEGNNLTIWSSTQSPFSIRQQASRVFGLPLSRIRVIVPHVGGGYGGGKGVLTSMLAVALSRLVRRPVRVAFTADENFKTTSQPLAKVTIKTGVKKDGTFLARRCVIYLNGGAYVNSTPSVAEKAGYRVHGPYRIPHVLSDSYAVYTNCVPTGAFRGFGGPQAAFAYESHLDMIAHRMKIDAVELRMKNLLNKGEEFAPGDTPIDCDLKGALKRLAEAIQWGKKDTSPKDPRIKRGKGIACGVKDGGGTSKSANAMVKILSDGSVLLSFGSVEIGQGVRTALLQVVAQELSIAPERIQVAELDTQYTPFDQATNASSATAITGQAVQRAARDTREQLLSAAASVLGTQRSAVSLEDGLISSDGRKLTFPEVMRQYFGDNETEIVGRGSFKFPRDDRTPLGSRSPFWEIGFGATEVEVDELTGEVRILKYVSLTDAGKMIHPLQCRGQDEGAVFFGIGLALFEELIYKDTRLINPNLVDYRLPRFRDLPQSFTTQILEEEGGPGPYGAKGMGEGGILAVAPAVCNAVHNAAGIRIQEVPLKGERVWQATIRNP